MARFSEEIIWLSWIGRRMENGHIAPTLDIHRDAVNAPMNVMNEWVLDNVSKWVEDARRSGICFQPMPVQELCDGPDKDEDEPVEYAVTVEGSFTVMAGSDDEAEEKANEYLSEYRQAQNDMGLWVTELWDENGNGRYC